MRFRPVPSEPLGSRPTSVPRRLLPDGTLCDDGPQQCNRIGGVPSRSCRAPVWFVSQPLLTAVTLGNHEDAALGWLKDRLQGSHDAPYGWLRSIAPGAYPRWCDALREMPLAVTVERHRAAPSASCTLNHPIARGWRPPGYSNVGESSMSCCLVSPSRSAGFAATEAGLSRACARSSTVTNRSKQSSAPQTAGIWTPGQASADSTV